MCGAAAALRDCRIDPEQHPDAVVHLAHDPDLLEAVRDGDVEIGHVSCEKDPDGDLYDALIDALARRQEKERRWEQAQTIRRWVKDHGHSAAVTVAETGTYYVVIDDWLKVRIADHSPLYDCHVDISPVGRADAASALGEIEELLNRYQH
ncbi:MAG: hypothetical protein IRZ06_12205 [Nevskia sp.]|nr:hypothetical protein [Nevskia sp.]